MKVFQRFVIAGYGAALAVVSVSLFPRAFGVIVDDGSWLLLLGVLIMTASGFAEFAGRRKEESRRNA